MADVPVETYIAVRPRAQVAASADELLRRRAGTVPVEEAGALARPGAERERATGAARAVGRTLGSAPTSR
ncbi:hypothetical protein ACIRRH_40935 [Kitasatospora sp. NPDC101235]|uniref:hypothetical protein n=1 Tax=Kitasatospora sp. NPDC101235 TaxID=3364101 RepID=UPI003806159A